MDVKLDLDPDYVEKTLADRLFTPRMPFNPYDDIICYASIYAPNGYSSSCPVNPVNIQTLAGKLISSNKKINSGDLSYYGSKITETGTYYYYRWKIAGGFEDDVGNGIASDVATLEWLIDKEEVRCQASSSATSAGSFAYYVSPCVRLWGPDDGKFGIVSMRAKSANMQPTAGIMWKGEKNMNRLKNIDPFKTHPSKFRHYVDLKIYDDTSWTTNPPINGKTYFDDKYYSVVPALPDFFTECYRQDVHVFYNDRTYIGYTQTIQPTIFQSTSTGSDTTMHEIGHSFCGLDDEYRYTPGKSSLGGINCVATSKGYGVWGDHNYQGCSAWDNYYRPTKNSIMRSRSILNGDKFNVIGCGSCLERFSPPINPFESGFSFTPYYKTCCDSMSVVKPDRGNCNCDANNPCIKNGELGKAGLMCKADGSVVDDCVGKDPSDPTDDCCDNYPLLEFLNPPKLICVNKVCTCKAGMCVSKGPPAHPGKVCDSAGELKGGCFSVDPKTGAAIDCCETGSKCIKTNDKPDGACSCTPGQCVTLGFSGILGSDQLPEVCASDGISRVNKCKGKDESGNTVDCCEGGYKCQGENCVSVLT